MGDIDRADLDAARARAEEVEELNERIDELIQERYDHVRKGELEQSQEIQKQLDKLFARSERLLQEANELLEEYND